MGLIHYTNTLFLGGGSSGEEYVWVEITPLQRWIWIIFGIGFLLLLITDKPINWYEILGVILGGVMILYVLIRNRISSPNYLHFNRKGIRGRLSAGERVYWPWSQIRRIEYRPVILVLYTVDGQTQVPLGHVDYRHRERVLAHLSEVAGGHEVVMKRE